MTNEQIALAKRAVACKGWRWMDGMVTTGGLRLVDGEYCATRLPGLLPDLTDPATLGCLLALVREAFKSDDRLWGGRVEVDQDSRRLFVVVCPEHDPNEFLYHRWIASGESEAEALVATLEAAPSEKAAYEAHMQALYDEQNWMQQMTERVEQLQIEVLSERKRADSLRRACREQRVKNDVLRAELEVTQRERDHFREAWAAAQARLDCGADAAEAVRGERAAVVAWLREEAEPSPQSFTVRGKEWAKRIDDVADYIERGEHRREEEK